MEAISSNIPPRNSLGRRTYAVAFLVLCTKQEEVQVQLDK